MAESVQSTYEEATRCPKCGNPGVAKKKTRSTTVRGAVIHHVYCEHQLCPWYNTCWMVQVNQDGSVPPPNNHRGSPKMYEGFEGHDEAAKQIVAALEAQALAEVSPDQEHHELRRPR